MKGFDDENKAEIIYNLINCAIAGFLVFLGSCTSGNITLNGLFVAFIAALIVAGTKFRDYWATQEKEYTITKKLTLFSFI